MGFILDEYVLGGSSVLLNDQILLYQNRASHLDVAAIPRVAVDATLLLVDKPHDGVPKDAFDRRTSWRNRLVYFVRWGYGGWLLGGHSGMLSRGGMGANVGPNPRIFFCSSSPIIKLLSWVISALITVVSPAA